MARKYTIQFPYEVSGLKGSMVSAALNSKEVHDALPRLKPALVKKLRACSFFHEESFSKADFDGIPEDLWAKLSKYL